MEWNEIDSNQMEFFTKNNNKYTIYFKIRWRIAKTNMQEKIIYKYKERN